MSKYIKLFFQNMKDDEPDEKNQLQFTRKQTTLKYTSNELNDDVFMEINNNTAYFDDTPEYLSFVMNSDEAKELYNFLKNKFGDIN